MCAARRANAQRLRRLRETRGWSWSDLARELQRQARALRFTRIANARVASVRRTIARWEEGSTVPDEQYQMLLAHAYARTRLGAVVLGPGSDFRELLEVFAGQGAAKDRLDNLTASVTSTTTDTGMSLLAFLGVPLRAELAPALAHPDMVGLDVLDGLAAAADAINTQIGSVPFVRLHLAHIAIVDCCRYLMRGTQPPPIRRRLQLVAGAAYALAARLAFETHDDVAALGLYDKAVEAIGAADYARRALFRSSQTMVGYYSTGDVGRARRIVDLAVRDAHRGESALMRARAHALQAEMAARGGPTQRRHAHVALHLAWHELDAGATSDPLAGTFSADRLRGFEGICGIFLGEAEAAEKKLGNAAAALVNSRESVQRAIVLGDRALARLRTKTPGAPEAAAEQLHECVDLTATTRGRVPAQRLRRARLELGPWRSEPFVAELDDHIHTALIGT